MSEGSLPQEGTPTSVKRGGQRASAGPLRDLGPTHPLGASTSPPFSAQWV